MRLLFCEASRIQLKPYIVYHVRLVLFGKGHWYEAETIARKVAELVIYLQTFCEIIRQTRNLQNYTVLKKSRVGAQNIEKAVKNINFFTY